MRPRAPLIVSAVLTLGFSLFALVAPEVMGATYGNDTAPDAALWGRYYGSAAFSLGLVTVYVLRARDARLERALAFALSAFYGVNLLVSLFAQVGGVVNELGWSNVALQVAMVASLLTSASARARVRPVGGGR